MSSVPTSAPDWETMQAEASCPLCEYNLRGLTEPRCPECGYSFRWEEILDERLRRHPYLFEHHPQRNIWSFFKTLIGGLNPYRFWKRLHPTQPSRPGRLALYALIILLSLLLLPAIDLWIQSPKTPTPGFFIWSRSYRETLGWRWEQHFPENLLARPLRMEARHLGIAALCALLVLPVAMYFLLLIFQQTMRRARIKRHHVLRCIIYSSDVLIWPILPFMVMILLNSSPAAANDWPETMAWTMLALFPLLWIVIAWRLSCAYRLYLRFDHPRATIFSVQLILLLILALIL